MKIIFFFRAILSDFLIYLLMLILGVAFAPFAACSRRLACESVRIYCLSCFIVLKYVAKITVEFRGEVPKKNVIICAKHMSFLDILMLAYILPRPRFVMKKELKWAPILGFYALRLGCSPVSRGKKGGAIVSLKKNINTNRNLGDGQTIIYPQGTRVLPGVKAPYKVGAGVIYRDQNLPCVLVATNTGIFWGRRSIFRYPGKAIIKFVEEIEPGLGLKEFMSYVEDTIERASDELMANNI